MSKAPVTLDEIFKAIIVISTPVLPKASDRALANRVDSKVEFASGNGVAKLRPCWCVRLTMDIEEKARTGDGQS